VSAWTVESYTSIPLHLHSDVFIYVYLHLEGKHRRLVYNSGGLALQKLGRKREVGTQLSRNLSKGSARDAEQHSTSGGSSSVTRAKLELPYHSPSNASG
jgi:hypothetical protein